MISTEGFLYGLMCLAFLMLAAVFYAPSWERSGLRRDLRRLWARIRGARLSPRHPAARIQFTEAEVFARFADIVEADREATGNIPKPRTSNEGDGS